MNKKSGTSKDTADKLVKRIRHKARKQYFGEEKIRIMLVRLRKEGLIGALVSKRGQLVKTRRRLLAQVKAHSKLGSAVIFEAMDAELKGLLDRQIAELEGVS